MAEKTRAELAAAILADLPNNTSKLISAATVRALLQLLVDSAPNILDEGPFGAPPASSATGIVYVNKGGNDTTGNGTMVKPYLTIGKALAVIATAADASASKPYLIDIGPGVYAENVQIIPWTFLKGYTTNSNLRKQFPGGADVLIAAPTAIDGTLSFGSGFSAANCYYGAYGLALLGKRLNLNLYDIGGAGKSVGLFRNCYTPTINNVSAGDIVFNGRGVNQDIVSFESVFADAGAQLFNGVIYVDSSRFNTGLTMGQSAGLTCNLTLNGTVVNGDAVMTGDASDASKVVFNFSASSFLNQWIQHDYATLNIDVASLPRTSKVTLSGHYTTVLENDAYGLGYSPATPGDWAGTAPTDVQQALDRLAAASSSPP